ncbi:MAG TPA: ribosome maturation factor RimP [Vicinamibacterales bacterium]|nr:ribosome maturation factor RimP [Vicinamibacterales bacterium]
MATEEARERVRVAAARVAGTYGLDIFDVQLRREAIGLVVRVFIDRPGPAATAEESVSIEDCARVSRDLSAVLDVEDVLPQAYTLEVSSPGLDRPLRNADDFRRFTGRPAKVVATAAVDGQTAFRGRIEGVEDGAVRLREGSRQHRIPLALIARARLDVEF